MIIPRAIHVTANGIISFIFMAELYLFDYFNCLSGFHSRLSLYPFTEKSREVGSSVQGPCRDIPVTEGPGAVCSLGHSGAIRV